MEQPLHQHGDLQNVEKFAYMLNENNGFDHVAQLLSQLVDPTRIRIFWLLCHYEGCVINISAIMNMSSPAVSHHLRSLKTAGLIENRRVGKEVYYKAVDSDEVRFLHQVIEGLMAITCPWE